MGADLSYANLAGADLSNTILTGATLDKAMLSGADMTNSVAVGTTFYDAEMNFVILRNADLSYSEFIAADLTNADLRNSNLMGSVQVWADLNFSYGINLDNCPPKKFPPDDWVCLNNNLVGPFIAYPLSHSFLLGRRYFRSFKSF
jgi:uncharacterized protein YjbI with pentapeptide repeats